jgi:hypothetical protein
LLWYWTTGKTPREIERQQQATRNAEKQRQQADQARQTITGLQAWNAYLTACKAATKPGHPDKPKWGARTLADHIALSAPGGVAYKTQVSGHHPARPAAWPVKTSRWCKSTPSPWPTG